MPESITPEFKADRLVRYLHAPGEVGVEAHREMRGKLIFTMRLDPQAYTEGTTNGVESYRRRSTRVLPGVRHSGFSRAC